MWGDGNVGARALRVVSGEDHCQYGKPSRWTTRSLPAGKSSSYATSRSVGVRERAGGGELAVGVRRGPRRSSSQMMELADERLLQARTIEEEAHAIVIVRTALARVERACDAHGNAERVDPAPVSRSISQSKA